MLCVGGRAAGTDVSTPLTHGDVLQVPIRRKATIDWRPPDVMLAPEPTIDVEIYRKFESFLVPVNQTRDETVKELLRVYAAYQELVGLMRRGRCDQIFNLLDKEAAK